MSAGFRLARWCVVPWCLAWSAALGASTVAGQQPSWMQNTGSAPRGAYYSGVARQAAGYGPAPTAAGPMTGGPMPQVPQGGYAASPTGAQPQFGGGAWASPSSAPMIPGATIPPSLAGAMPGGAPGVAPASYMAPAAPQVQPAYAPAPAATYTPAYYTAAAPAVSPAGPQWNAQGTMTTVRPSVAQIMSASRSAPTVPQQTQGVRPAAYAAPQAAPYATPAAGARPLAFPGRPGAQGGASPMTVPQMAGRPMAGPQFGTPYMASAPQAMPAGVLPTPQQPMGPGFSGGDYSGPPTSYETLPGSVMQRPTAGPYGTPNMWGGGPGPTPDQMSTGYGAAGPYGAYGSGGPAAAPLYDPGMYGGEGYGGSSYGGGCDTCDPCMGPTRGGSCGPWFVSLAGLYMTRDVPNNVGLASLGTEPAISVLNTEQAGFDWVGGWEGRVGRSIGDRWAIEAVYWGLQPMETEISARGPDNVNSRLDFGTQAFEGVLMADYFNNSREQRVKRVNEFHNVEVNLLQSAAMVDPAGRFGMTFFSGFRYFRYREDFDYMGTMAGAEFFQNDFTTQAGYQIKAKNHLIGWQIGSRGHLYLGEKFRLYAVPRVGIFVNNISQYQELCMVINMHSRKTDLALMGQLDLGMSYQLFRCCSIFGGYRAMGIAGVANADDNIPISFMSQPDMAQINSSGSIILHGAQAGIQFQF